MPVHELHERPIFAPAAPSRVPEELVEDDHRSLADIQSKGIKNVPCRRVQIAIEMEKPRPRFLVILHKLRDRLMKETGDQTSVGRNIWGAIQSVPAARESGAPVVGQPLKRIEPVDHG